MAKSVVVTGANSGIGLVTCLELAAAGYDVVGTARSAAKARDLHDAADARGLVLRSVVCDIGDSASTEAGFAEIAELTDGGPWAVVNNAGFAQAGAVEDVDDEAVRDQLEVNLVAPARIARLVLPAMRERGDGRILNISSIAGRMSLPLMGWYCDDRCAADRGRTRRHQGDPHRAGRFRHRHLGGRALPRGVTAPVRRRLRPGTADDDRWLRADA
jgi:NAD(P)-dependent dehydrogenase (short-subunit alcohol dehydrogenase family)